MLMFMRYVEYMKSCSAHKVTYIFVAHIFENFETQNVYAYAYVYKNMKYHIYELCTYNPRGQIWSALRLRPQVC